MAAPEDPRAAYLRILREAQAALLANASSEVPGSSATLIARVEAAKPRISGDVIRHAYWDLVSDGRLIRVPTGVLRVLAG